MRSFPRSLASLVAALLTVATLAVLAGAAEASDDYHVFAVAPTGDPAPGTGGGLFGGTDDWVTGIDSSSTGFFVIAAVVEGGETTGALYEVRRGSLRPLRFQGDPTPVGGTYSSLSMPSMATDRSVAFRAYVAGGSVSAGIFRLGRHGSDDELVVAAGDPAPGTGGGSFSIFSHLSLNASGDVLFQASIAGGSGGDGLFLASEGAVTAVAVSSQNSPRGSPYYTGFTGGHLNDDGKVAFAAWDEIGPLVVSGEPDGQTVVVADGMVAPGTGGDVHQNWLTTGFLGVGLAEDGRVSYLSSLSLCADELVHPVFGLIWIPYHCAVFEWDDGATELVVRDGQAPPQGGPLLHAFIDAGAGEAGDIVVNDFTGSASDGIYARLDGELVTIALEAAIPGIPLSTTPHPHTARINADREVLFLVTFFDPARDAALYLARPSAISAPALSRVATVVLALALIAAAAYAPRARVGRSRR